MADEKSPWQALKDPQSSKTDVQAALAEVLLASANEGGGIRKLLRDQRAWSPERGGTAAFLAQPAPTVAAAARAPGQTRASLLRQESAARRLGVPVEQSFLAAVAPAPAPAAADADAGSGSVADLLALAQPPLEEEVQWLRGQLREAQEHERRGRAESAALRDELRRAREEHAVEKAAAAAAAASSAAAVLASSASGGGGGIQWAPLVETLLHGCSLGLLELDASLELQTALDDHASPQRETLKVPSPASRSGEVWWREAAAAADERAAAAVAELASVKAAAEQAAAAAAAELAAAKEAHAAALAECEAKQNSFMEAAEVAELKAAAAAAEVASLKAQLEQEKTAAAEAASASAPAKDDEHTFALDALLRAAEIEEPPAPAAATPRAAGAAAASPAALRLLARGQAEGIEADWAAWRHEIGTLTSPSSAALFPSRGAVLASGGAPPAPPSEPQAFARGVAALRDDVEALIHGARSR